MKNTIQKRKRAGKRSAEWRRGMVPPLQNSSRDDVVLRLRGKRRDNPFPLINFLNLINANGDTTANPRGFPGDMRGEVVIIANEIKGIILLVHINNIRFRNTIIAKFLDKLP